VLCLAALFITLSSLAATEAAKPKDRKTRVSELRNRLKKIAKKKAEKRQQIQEMKQAQGKLSDLLNNSYQRLENANNALKTSETRLRKAEAAVESANRRVASAQEQLGKQQKLFGRRVAASYKEGPVTYADVLAGSRNLSDFLDRQYYVSRVMGRDASLLSDLRDAKVQLAAEQERLIQWKGNLSLAHRENAEQLAQVAYEASERERLLEAISRERELQEQRLAELEQDSLDLQQELQGEGSRRRSNPGAYRNLPRWTGRLAKPANGPITSGFGYRHHPVLKYRRLHTGLDIGAASGSPVYAAEAGEVFFASWRGGYGRCIILLHGGGMQTLYGHLSRIDVSSGQSIARGQQIGAVGSTGLSTGPHLHFEVRRNGVPVNPM
jgi:murein DD-endopeptidase MepM/ murein hydrolase activator NlpD